MRASPRPTPGTMNMRVTQGYGALTEKEKQTLRLIVRGHDAKSIARSLDLSVHTINERLRDARRKLAVSSSREAARLLLDTEGEAPQSLGDIRIGEVAPASISDRESAPTPGAGWPRRLVLIVTGAVLMTLALGFLILAVLPQLADSSRSAPPPAASPTDAVVVDAARQWLVLVDQGRWQESYEATAGEFRRLNTVQAWKSVSERVRTPLGATLSRVLMGQQNLDAPPWGYAVIKFRTSFANKAEAVETVTLERTDSGWRVVGVTVE